jgi:hypothetical protein
MRSSEHFTERLPKISNIELQAKPPLVFRDVSACCFPLRANLDILQQLCDGYLNIVPCEAGFFRAALPYVFLTILDYGQMGDTVHAGWFSQVEVYFGIFVEWYKRVRGRWQFRDWGVITPYIFVTDDISMAVGRSVYGFPKIYANVDLIDSKWIKNPSAPVTLARINTAVFPNAYSGTNFENRVLLEINRIWLSDIHVPPNPVGPVMPWTIASNLASAMGGFGRDAMWLSQAMRICPVTPFSNEQIFPQMLGRMPQWFSPGGQGFIVNSLNLKQFRQSQEPSLICYQALTKCRLRTTAFSGGGLLGEDRVMLGDLSGGHSIKLYEYPSLPIAETLGLEVHRSVPAGDISFKEFKPVAPFFMNVDLTCDPGVNVAWRAEDGVWKDDAGNPFGCVRKPAQEDGGPKYNNTVSTTVEAITGPFEFFDVTIRVLPLMARKKQLQQFLDRCLNQPKNINLFTEITGQENQETSPEIEFEVWARNNKETTNVIAQDDELAYVYLVVASFGAVTSKTNNVGNWNRYELEFLVPIQWQRKASARSPQERKQTGVGMVPAFSFVDGDIAAFTRFEIQGIPTMMAKFRRPESAWLRPEGNLADPKQSLLGMDAEVLPALGTGQTAKFHPVIHISQQTVDAVLGGNPAVLLKWAEFLKNDLEHTKATKVNHFDDFKHAHELAFNLLCKGGPFSFYTLKQIPDASNPGKACYQSLVRISRSIRKPFHVQEIEGPLAVRIYDYPTLKIVADLGLVGESRQDKAAGIVYDLPVVRPFYLNANVNEPLAQELASRTGATGWTLNKQAFEAEDQDIFDIPDWMNMIFEDQADPSLEDMFTFEASKAPIPTPNAPVDAGQKNAEKASKEDLTKALRRIGPQMLIESILSREWFNDAPNIYWRRGRAELLKKFDALPQRGDAKPLAEALLYRQVNNSRSSCPGGPATMIPSEDFKQTKELAKTLLPREKAKEPPKTHKGKSGSHEDRRSEMLDIIDHNLRFTIWQLHMERSLKVLAAYGVLTTAEVKEVHNFLDEIEKPMMKDLPTEWDWLLRATREISKLSVQSVGKHPLTEINPVVQADRFRLEEMIRHLEGVLRHQKQNAFLELLLAHREEFCELVNLARRCCEAQRAAVINALSRTYQKPDFCIRRDVFGRHRDQYLPLSLSWNEDWYYGPEVDLKKRSPKIGATAPVESDSVT